MSSCGSLLSFVDAVRPFARSRSSTSSCESLLSFVDAVRLFVRSRSSTSSCELLLSFVDAVRLLVRSRLSTSFCESLLSFVDAVRLFVRSRSSTSSCGCLFVVRVHAEWADTTTGSRRVTPVKCSNGMRSSLRRTADTAVILSLMPTLLPSNVTPRVTKDHLRGDHNDLRVTRGGRLRRVSAGHGPS
jgi:hypothetical protein